MISNEHNGVGKREVVNVGYFADQYIYLAILEFVYFIYTYIIGHCNLSVRIIDLVSHTTYVIFIYKWRNLQFKVDYWIFD